MDDSLAAARDHFIQGMSRISNFWGFPRAMGAIYAAIYLSPQPLSLDDLVARVGVSKGAVSTNVRHLERLGMVHKHIKIASRKDYYLAETDFWGVAKGILKERKQSEFDSALNSVDESLTLVDQAAGAPEQDELAAFYRQRLESMRAFFQALDSLVAALLKLDNIVSLNALHNLLGGEPQD